MNSTLLLSAVLEFQSLGKCGEQGVIFEIGLNVCKTKNFIKLGMLYKQNRGVLLQEDKRLSKG